MKIYIVFLAEKIKDLGTLFRGVKLISTKYYKKINNVQFKHQNS